MKDDDDIFKLDGAVVATLLTKAAGTISADDAIEVRASSSSRRERNRHNGRNVARRRARRGKRRPMTERISISLDVDVQVPASPCCECGYELSAAMGERQPQPGDPSLCIECGSLNIFDDKMHMRKPTDEEMLEAARQPVVQRMRAAILHVRESRETKKKLQALVDALKADPGNIGLRITLISALKMAAKMGHLE